MTPPFEDRPLVYVAGPYSDDPLGNTNRAITEAEYLVRHGLTPVVPHLSILWDLVEPHPVEWWYRYDLALLARCDALYRFPGESTGADLEVEFANVRGIPVLKWDTHDADALIEFAKTWRQARVS